MSDISSELLDPTCVGLSEFESVITPDVIMAYRTAHYSFQIDSDTIDFSIGRCKTWSLGNFGAARLLPE